MQIGELRDKVTIQEYIQTPDGYGGFSETWQDKYTVWANIKPLRGREYFEMQKIQSEITHKITIRYRSDINTSNRIRYKDQILNIKSVIDIDNRHRYLEIMCIGSDQDG
ncbi:MAG: hypothetical protein PWQ96_2178 [Clostridia bacterium]|jgi:SPP1 family predicted phage head-tail adaptor|nr:hypothetical protein [Clostridia bacterium]